MSTRAAFSWTVVIVVAALLVALSGYETRDPDSKLYATMSARMASRPLSTWIAPSWEGSWDIEGLFREHPIGIFVLPALLGRAGYPIDQAAFAIGALFSALTIYLLRSAASPLVKAHEAIAVQWAALVLPIAFVYRVRANQEYPVLVLTLAALVATERSRRRPAWIAGVVAAAVALTLVKGIFVAFLIGVCGLWLLIVPRARGQASASEVAPWVGVVLAAAAVLMTAWAYEQVYMRSTGESFLDFYFTQRVGENAGLQSGRGFNPAEKLVNVGWYLVRLLWFAVPGSLVLIASATRIRRARAESLRGIWFVLIASAGYVGAMSLGANRADRFIFPAYFLVGLAGAVVAMRRWTAIDRFGHRLAYLPPFALPLAWLGFFLLTLGINTGLGVGQ